MLQLHPQGIQSTFKKSVYGRRSWVLFLQPLAIITISIKLEKERPNMVYKIIFILFLSISGWHKL